MNQNQIQGNWKMMKGKAKVQWARDELVVKLQKVYGISREEAEARVDKSSRTLQ